MNILEAIDAEVQQQADDKLEAVLVNLLKRLSAPTSCEQRLALLDYIQSKLELHRVKKTHRSIWNYGHTWANNHFGWGESDSRPYCGEDYWAKLENEHAIKAEGQRRKYYESECSCGSCRSRRESQRIKYVGAPAGR